MDVHSSHEYIYTHTQLIVIGYTPHISNFTVVCVCVSVFVHNHR